MPIPAEKSINIWQNLDVKLKNWTIQLKKYANPGQKINQYQLNWEVKLKKGPFWDQKSA